MSAVLRLDDAPLLEMEARAMILLNENLSSVQRDQLGKQGCFEVIGGTTGKRYRIRSEYRMNVEELTQDGRRLRVLCFGPRGAGAVGDIMLAQKLALELFELEVLALTNMMPREPLIQ